MKKIKTRKDLILGTLFLAAVFVAVISGIYYWKYSSSLIIDQIVQESNLNCLETVPVKAVNKYTGEVKEFPNSCVFPRGWEKVSKQSDTTSTAWKIYRNEDYGFEIKVPPDFKGINYVYNGSVDYVGVYLTNNETPDLLIKPQGSADLTTPTTQPKESAYSSISGRSVKVNKWDLGSGKSLIRYIFVDKIPNWNSCASVDKPDVNCNRIDLISSNQKTQDKLIEMVGNLSFFKPVSEKTTNTVYYWADNSIRTYSPSTGKETSKSLVGLDSYITIRKTPSGDKLVYLNHDQVVMYNMSSGTSDILFAKNSDGGVTSIPNNFVISPDGSKVAVGYLSGSESDIANCSNKCNNVQAGLLIFDLSSKYTRSSFILPALSSPVKWIGSNIVLNKLFVSSSPQYITVTEDGNENPTFQVPKDIVAATVASNIIRIDRTGAAGVRNYEDRYGKGSYLFVNGKVVYKGNLGSINIVQD